jgi:hypothetical protein
MRFPANVPIQLLSSETGEPLEGYEDFSLPCPLYMALRRDARKAGQTFHDFFSAFLREAIGMLRKSPEFRAEVFSAAKTQ